ncbi:MAG: leucine-rich repeat protein [Clostridia bacterium]|nr:leucine-rich repeat protein [Clostridia bacterium]
MKKRKITASILSVMIFLTTLFANVSFAQNTTPTVTVQSVTDTAGSTVNVNVTLENNPGILGATLTFTYDSGLTLSAAENGEAFSALTMTKPGTFVSPCNFTWDGQDIGENDIKDGVILTLHFKIDDNAEADTVYHINASYTNGDFVDSDLNPIDVAITNGTVTVVDYMPGDLDGNNKINTTDVILLRRHIAGGYNQTINESAADVNSDGKRNTTDVILIRRFIAGGYGVELKPSKPQCAHILTATEYKAPTCTEDGNIAYWHCSVCDKDFSDANGTSQVNDVVIPATGHTVVIDEAVEPTYESTGLTEGKHCSVCHTVIQEQTVIPKLQRDEYAITYYIDNNDNYLKTLDIENPNPSVYAKEDGLELQDLYVDGYNFIGWFTAQTGGTQVTQIAPGTTGKKTLYAHWEKVSFTVQLACDMLPQSDLYYTTNQGKVLPKPTVDKYTFVGWSDEDGNMWDNIPKGTTGDFTLYANWASDRNKAEAKTALDDPLIFVDSNKGVMLFAYEIGEIKNVPLFVNQTLLSANGIITTKSQTVTSNVTASQAKTIAQTVSKATTNSASWTLSRDWNSSTEISQSYLDETSQTREEAERYAVSSSGTYNTTKSKGGSKSTTKTSNGSFKISGNVSHSDTNTTETGQNAELSVNGKYYGEVSANVPVPGATIGGKTGFELGAGAEYGNYRKTTDTSTDGWSISPEISNSKSKTSNKESNWSSSSSFTTSNSVSRDTSVSNVVSSKISSQYGYGQSYSEGGSNSQSQSLSSTDQKSDEYSSSVTYSTSDITSTTVSYQTTGDTIGSYRIVCAGTIHVFGVVGYDVASASYFQYTYNVMDDDTYDYMDYSRDGTFTDYETTVIPFEIPFYVKEYVDSHIVMSDGLKIDRNSGIINEYNGTDSVVFIPSFYRIENNDGTYSSVTVNGISPTLFKNNTDLVGVSLGMYIEEIPQGAFEGCTSLKEILCPAVSEIGTNAFKNCTSLSKFNIPYDVTAVGENAFENVPEIKAVASTKETVAAIAASGADRIILDISTLPSNERENLTIEVGNDTEYFELQGKENTFKALKVVSDAGETVISGITITDANELPLDISSVNVTLDRVTINSTCYGLVLSGENVDLKLNGTNQITSAQKEAMLCKNITLSELTTSETGRLNILGNVYTTGNIENQSLMTIENGNVNTVSDFEEQKNKQFIDIWDGTSKEPKYDPNTKTYTITSGEELAWISDVSNQVITSGINFPNDTQFSGYKIELSNDIYLNDTTEWENWGNAEPDNSWKPIRTFKGEFDGKNHAIYGMYFNISDKTPAGLFSSIPGAVIKNIGVSQSYMIGYYAGAISGRVNNGGAISTIKNSYNAGIVIGENAAGGIIGEGGNGIIDNCYNVGRVSSGKYAGGIAGSNNYAGAMSSSIANCYNSGHIESSQNLAGGIAGYFSMSTMSCCYNIGVVEYELVAEVDNEYAPFYDSYRQCELTNCYSLGNKLYELASTVNNSYLSIRNVSSKTTSQMKNLSNLSGLSTSVWATNPSINDGYPYLIALEDTY